MRLRNLLPLLALLALPVVAQDVHFGFHVGASFPQSDLKDAVDSKLGYTAGIFVPIEFNGGHTIRPRLDYTYDKGTQDGGGGYIADNKVTTTHLGVDYLYNVSGKAGEGFYLFAGVGYANTKIQSDITIVGLGSGSADDNKSAFAWGAGMGFAFTPMVGAELRYASTHPDFGTSSFIGGTAKNDCLNLSVTFRF